MSSIHTKVAAEHRSYIGEAVEKFKEAQRVMNIRAQELVNEYAEYKIGDRMQSSCGTYQIQVDRIKWSLDRYSMGNNSIEITYQGPRITKSGKTHGSARGLAWQWLNYGSDAEVQS